MNHQIDQLKEEIQAKENALLKEHFEHQRVEKDKENLKSELNRLKQQAQESKAYIEAQEAEERKLLKIIAEADAERVRQKKELDQVQLDKLTIEPGYLNQYANHFIEKSVLSKSVIFYNFLLVTSEPWFSVHRKISSFLKL